MALRETQFLEVAESWVRKQPISEVNSESQIPNDVWEEKYLDKHHLNLILKVNSHQLNTSGTRIKNNPRYKHLIPNLRTWE